MNRIKFYSIVKQTLFCIIFTHVLYTGNAVAQCIAPPADITAWWTFDEASGAIAAERVNNKNGSYANNPLQVTGIVENALRFDGNDYVAAADDDLWNLSNRDFTIEFWANFDQPGGGSIGHPSDIFIGNDDGPGTRNKWFFALGGGFLNFHINGSTGSRFFPLAPFSPTVGQWYHLAITRNGNLYTIYVNGQLIASAIDTRVIPNSVAPLTIGQAEQLGFMNGRLDEMTMYNRALSQAELQLIHDAANDGKCKDIIVRPSSGGNAGIVTLQITGAGFQDGATVKLTMSGEQDIQASSVIVGQGGTSIRAELNLTGATLGLWNIEINNPMFLPTVLENGFTIELADQRSLWADIIGFPVFRPSRPQTYHILYGNDGNLDVDEGLLLVSGIPLGASVDVVLDPPATPPLHPEYTLDAPTVFEMDSEQAIGISLHNITSDVTRGISFTINNSNASTQNLRALMYFEPTFKLSREFPAPTFEGCTKLSCVDAEDRDAVTEALGVARRNWIRDNLFTQAFNTQGLCIGAAANLKADLESKTLEQDSNLSGWGFAAINGCGTVNVQGRREHNSTMITSPITGDRWLIDNSAFPQICKMYEVALNQWETPQCGFMKSTCKWSIDPSLPVTPCRPPEEEDTLSSDPIQSFDPNDKVGPNGADISSYVSVEDNLPYAIFFENLETASASAQEVFITDQVDISLLESTTLSLGPIYFGNHHVIPPVGSKQYGTDVDLRPEQNLLVRIRATFDPESGMAQWIFRSIDPQTGELTTDPTAGFLPANINPPEGEGAVLFTVKPKSELVTGTEISNNAIIVFDTNEPIITPLWVNVIDSTNPESTVLPIEQIQAYEDFQVEWSGTDEGAGIAGYSIYVSTNGLEPEIWQENVESTVGVFRGNFGDTYEFYSIAIDRVGNNEQFPDTPDTSTTVSTDLDGDHVSDLTDNCEEVFNPDQIDLDADGEGDACDSDRDGDNTPNNSDAFPDDPSEIADNDGDGTGDNADLDDDNDGFTDIEEGECGSNPTDAASTCANLDNDGDGVANVLDNCPAEPNPDQADSDKDGTGDACDTNDERICSVDGDGDVDRKDLRLILRGRGQSPDEEFDPRDANGDGRISFRDVVRCIRECDRRFCRP